MFERYLGSHLGIKVLSGQLLGDLQIPVSNSWLLFPSATVNGQVRLRESESALVNRGIWRRCQTVKDCNADLDLKKATLDNGYDELQFRAIPAITGHESTKARSRTHEGGQARSRISEAIQKFETERVRGRRPTCGFR
jgi:hypothetical protein